jgi:hypothetical protein
MSIQDELNVAAQEYGQRLELKREENRLAALRIEAQRRGNASAFAEALERAIADHIDTTDDFHTEENHS